jgi:hypothetical protein
VTLSLSCKQIVSSYPPGEFNYITAPLSNIRDTANTTVVIETVLSLFNPIYVTKRYVLSKSKAVPLHAVEAFGGEEV